MKPVRNLSTSPQKSKIPNPKIGKYDLNPKIGKYNFNPKIGK